MKTFHYETSATLELRPVRRPSRFMRLAFYWITVTIGLVIAWLLSTGAVRADVTKQVEKHIAVDAAQTISLEGISGAKITIKSWDKSEVYVNLLVKVSSSSDDEERLYADSMKVVEYASPSLMRIRLWEPSERVSGFKVFGVRIHLFYSFSKDISGEIYVPRKNALTSDVRYTTLSLDNMSGELRLPGKSNTLELTNCANIRQITNDYGKTTIKSSGGRLDFKGRSGALAIEGFAGALAVEADYTSMILNDVKQDVRIKSRSSALQIDRVEGNLTVDADYATIAASNVKGFADIESRSGTVTVKNVGGTSVRAEYSTIDVTGVTGDTTQALTLKTRSGSIRLENAVGRMSIDAPYSKVLLKHVRGDVSLSATNSRLWVDGLAGNWTSSTSYMECSFQEMAATTMWMSNKNGLIDIKLKTVPKNLTIQNEYGEARVMMPQGFAGYVSADAEHGQIETNLNLSRTESSHTMTASGTVGAPSGKSAGSISIKTRSANIKLFQL